MPSNPTEGQELAERLRALADKQSDGYAERLLHEAADALPAHPTRIEERQGKDYQVQPVVPPEGAELDPDAQYGLPGPIADPVLGTPSNVTSDRTGPTEHPTRIDPERDAQSYRDEIEELRRDGLAVRNELKRYREMLRDRIDPEPPDYEQAWMDAEERIAELEDRLIDPEPVIERLRTALRMIVNQTSENGDARTLARSPEVAKFTDIEAVLRICHDTAEAALRDTRDKEGSDG